MKLVLVISMVLVLTACTGDRSSVEGPPPTLAVSEATIEPLSTEQLLETMEKNRDRTTWSYRISTENREYFGLGEVRISQTISRPVADGPTFAAIDYTDVYDTVIASKPTVDDLPEDAFEDFTPALLRSAGSAAEPIDLIIDLDRTYVQYGTALTVQIKYAELFVDYYEGYQPRTSGTDVLSENEAFGMLSGKWVATDQFGDLQIETGLAEEAHEFVNELMSADFVHSELMSADSAGVMYALFELTEADLAGARAEGRFIPHALVRLDSSGTVVGFEVDYGDIAHTVEFVSPIDFDVPSPEDVLTAPEVAVAAGISLECAKAAGQFDYMVLFLTNELCQQYFGEIDEPATPTFTEIGD